MPHHAILRVEPFSAYPELPPPNINCKHVVAAIDEIVTEKLVWHPETRFQLDGGRESRLYSCGKPNCLIFPTSYPASFSLTNRYHPRHKMRLIMWHDGRQIQLHLKNQEQAN